jgi:hypothetical protein
MQIKIIDKTIYKYFSIFRKIINDYFINYIPYFQLSGEVVIDECYQKCKPKYNRGRRARDRGGIVFGTFERVSKQFPLKHIPDCRSDTIMHTLQDNITNGSTVFSDSHATYVNNRRNVSRKEDFINVEH